MSAVKVSLYMSYQGWDQGLGIDFEVRPEYWPARPRREQVIH